jgi:phosphotransferase system enzyme I (PtsP)
MDERGGHVGSRRLLGRLRDVMAAPEDDWTRLDQVVAAIAADIEAEVCSVYLLRAGDILELSATRGLFPEAVHRTRLRVGEGLVGVIAATARPLALSDAQAHPNFVFRPETGEEIYHSLMGVPILRQGRVVGVLVVQNRNRRHYADEEIEALQTVAMVLAELTVGGGLVSPDELHPTQGIAVLPHRLEGIQLSPGLAIGTAVIHQPSIEIDEVVADNPEIELLRLGRATEEMHTALDRLFEASDLGDRGAHREILETYRMFASDRGWLGRIREAIRGGLTAEAAVQKIRDDTRARMIQITDPYIRERMADLEDLANRLQHHLTGRPITASNEDLPDDMVLIARHMGPAELLDYDRRKLRALVLEEGSPAAHVTIVAKALDIPVVGLVKGALANIDPGDQVAVDGDGARIMIRPSEDVVATIEAALAIRRTRLARYAALRDLPATSKDGVTVALHINAGLLIDLPALATTNADGIGLYRTELPFMLSSHFPTVSEQTELYRMVLDSAGDKPVVFRTLDIGGDKLLPYLPGMREDNPAMGWRAIRLALDRPSMLRHQLRALIHAANGRPLSVMFPMVGEIAEYAEARRILDLELARAAARGRNLPARLRLGAMLEVPALVWQLDALAGRADFVSVGSNDLIQFLFARDRGNARLAERYDTLSGGSLACLGAIVEAAARAGIAVSLCGEMAGSPLDAMVLVGLGYRSLSMAPSAIGPVKSMIRSLDVGMLASFLATRRASPARSLRPLLREFARDHEVTI